MYFWILVLGWLCALAYFVFLKPIREGREYTKKANSIKAQRKHEETDKLLAVLLGDTDPEWLESMGITEPTRPTKPT